MKLPTLKPGDTIKVAPQGVCLMSVALEDGEDFRQDVREFRSGEVLPVEYVSDDGALYKIGGVWMDAVCLDQLLTR